MKRHFFFLLLIAFGWSVNGQTNSAVLRELDSSSTQFNAAYEHLKEFRNSINKAEREISQDTCIEDSIDPAYEELFRSLEKAGIGLPTKTTQLVADRAYFRCAKTVSLLNQLKLQKKDTSLHKFLTALKILELNNLNYEPRLFEISLESIETATGDTLINTLISRYNENLASVGRRMGRLIQSTVLEDDDYVTPASYTRLDIAISDLKTAELHLRNALSHKEPNIYPNAKKVVINNYYTLIDTTAKRNDYSYFVGASTDLKKAIGMATLFSWHKPGNMHLDAGIDLYFRFVNEGDVLIHPKIGIPIEDFHFLIGLLGSPINSSDFNTTLTANVYYSKDKLFAGIGLGVNTILFTVGFGGGRIK